MKIIKTISMDKYYDEPNHKEDANTEDGIHDMYPVDGDPDRLFVSTGEHAFFFNLKDHSFERLPSLYTVPSKNSQAYRVAVKDKGGIKSISKDASANVIFARSSPWFKEVSGNYDEKAPILLWSMSKPGSGFCNKVDYDLTNTCKINFDQLKPIRFYKARVFKQVP
jgi:hypothetical protein